MRFCHRFIFYGSWLFFEIRFLNFGWFSVAVESSKNNKAFLQELDICLLVNLDRAW